MDHTPYSRRAFITRGLTLASAAVTIPHFLDLSARALAQDFVPGQTSQPGIDQDRVLVVVQLAGGNDGLNTVVPYGFDAYYKSRPSIAIPKRDALVLPDADGIGLHPKLAGLKNLYDDGMLSVIQGVGYPNPNRSHFKSMDIWHTADTSGTGEGWLGRYFDNQCSGAPGGLDGHACAGEMGVAIGRAAPLAMEGRAYKPVAFESADLFRWTGSDMEEGRLDPLYRKIAETERVTGVQGGDTAASFLMRTALDAQVASDRIRKAVNRKPEIEYPRTGLARQLSMVASMIAAGLPTRVYYVSLGGFDTHAGQGGVNGTQANLLEQLGGGVKAFYDDLAKQGNDRRVLTMSFSEFGRRVGQNASGGTDHGTAAPMFLAGPMVRPGVLGKHPSLTDLDNGDLKYTSDFRSVYAGILQQWLKADAEKILDGRYQAAKLVRV